MSGEVVESCLPFPSMCSLLELGDVGKSFGMIVFVSLMEVRLPWTFVVWFAPGKRFLSEVLGKSQSGL